MKMGSSELGSSQDRASSSVNDTGTCEKGDTQLTQRRSRRVLGKLIGVTGPKVVGVGLTGRGVVDATGAIDLPSRPQ